MRIGSGVAALVTGMGAVAAAVVWGGPEGPWAAEGSAEPIVAEELQDHPAGEDLVLRRVAAGQDVDGAGNYSLDGHGRVFHDWDTGDLVFEDLETGEERHLTDDGDADAGEGFALDAYFAPGGQHVAVYWMDHTGPDEVRVIDVESGEVRSFPAEDDEWQMVYPTSAWTPDGEAFVASLSDHDGEQRLGLMDATTGDLQLLRDGREGRASPTAISPDGEWVAYFLDEEQDEGADDPALRRLHMAPLDGGPEVATDVVAPNGSVVGWLQGGGPLYYQTGRDGIMTLVAQSMDGPEAASEPRAVKRDLVNPSFIGTGEDGVAFWQSIRDPWRVRLFELDDEAAALVERTGPTPGPPSEEHWYAHWTDGGATLAYTVPPPETGKKASLVLRSPSTGDERRVTLPLASALFPQVTTNGDLFVGSGRRERGPSPSKSYLIEIEDGVAGDPTPLSESGTGRCLGLRRGGEEAICTVRAESEEESREDRRFVARSLADGEDEVLRTVPDEFLGMSLSPARDEVAVAREAGDESVVVEVLDLRSDDRQELWRSPTAESLRLDWSADGEAVHFVEQGSVTAPEDWRVHVVDREAPNPKAFDLPDGLRPAPVASGSLHPDGSTLALEIQEGSTDRGEIWVMENLPDEVR